jgi:hypothetical protein
MSESSSSARRGYRNVGTRGSTSNRRIGFRSRSQMKRDNAAENKQAEDFVAAVSAKAGHKTPEQVKRTNPSKETPDPHQPLIKLDHYTADWIETDRKNIQVELREDFEDQVMMAHTNSIAFNTDALQYEDQEQIGNMLLAFFGYSYCNVAYRLIQTVPSSNRSSVADWLREIRDADQPSNTPAMAEMLSHLGKSDIPSYGRLRIDSPLLNARRRVARAVFILRDCPPFRDEFQFNHGMNADNLEHFRLLIWNDQDSMDYVRQKASEYVKNQLMIIRNLDDISPDRRAEFPADADDLLFCFPYIDVTLTHPNGSRRYLTPDEVVDYWYKIRIYNQESTRRLMACLIMLATTFDYFHKGNKALENDNARWRENERAANFPYMRSTADQITTYMAFIRLQSIMDDRRLRFNYHVITNNFIGSFRSRLNRIFDFVSVSKEEFGDESQALVSNDNTVFSNPLLNSQFQFRDKQKIAAGGIFRYAFKVRHHLAEEMIMKRTRTSMISEIINKFCKRTS